MTTVVPKYGTVEVLQESPNLVQIRTPEGREFWVPKSKETPRKPNPRVFSHHRIPGDFASWRDSLLETGRYALYLEVHPDDETAERAKYEDAAKEPLPDDCCGLFLSKALGPQWRMLFRPSDDLSLPFNVVPAGSGGSRTAKEPVFIEHADGTVELSSNAIVLEMVRLGLRAKG